MKPLTSQQIRSFQKTIYNYYIQQGRDLPWRKTTNPYHILVSEIMLQQTQVDRVVTKYEHFIATFPDFQALATAEVKEVLVAWQGLGYNRRALNLKKLAEIVVRDFNGVLPDSPDLLKTLPCIGPATAASICAFAFNLPTVFIETNIRSVFIHFFFKNKKQVHDDELLPLVQQTLDRSQSGTWYSALMDYGVMLKKTYGNPSRKSAHHYKQSSFIGSDRQIRGMILKLLLSTTSLSQTDLIKALKSRAPRLSRILVELKQEGFIVQKNKSGKVHYELVS